MKNIKTWLNESKKNKIIAGVTAAVVLVGVVFGIFMLVNKADSKLYNVVFEGEDVSITENVQYVSSVDFDAVVAENGAKLKVYVDGVAPETALSFKVETTVPKASNLKEVVLPLELSEKVAKDEMTLQDAVAEANKEKTDFKLADFENVVTYTAVLDDSLEEGYEENPDSMLDINVSYIIVVLTNDIDLSSISDTTVDFEADVPTFELVLPSTDYTVEYVGLDKVDTKKAGTYEVTAKISYKNQLVASKEITITVNEEEPTTPDTDNDYDTSYNSGGGSGNSNNNNNSNSNSGSGNSNSNNGGGSNNNGGGSNNNGGGSTPKPDPTPDPTPSAPYKYSQDEYMFSLYGVDHYFYKYFSSYNECVDVMDSLITSNKGTGCTSTMGEEVIYGAAYGDYFYTD